MFKVGDKVICIDDILDQDIPLSMRPKLFVKKGTIYTIRGIEYCKELRMYGVLLEEIVNPPVLGVTLPDYKVVLKEPLFKGIRFARLLYSESSESLTEELVLTGQV